MKKIRIVYQWVQRNIKYIAFEDGMAGFIPRSAEDVYIKRYGDCKDMANLLRDMLKLCGIEAYHTWIGTRSKPYSYRDVPAAIVNNHMICSVKTSAGYLFLDATNPFLAYGNPSSMIQGKEALIGLAPDKYLIETVPVVNLSKNCRRDSIIVTLEKNGINGWFEGTLTGYKKDDLEVDQLQSEINNDKNHIRDFFTIGNNNISIEELFVRGLGDGNMPAQVRFKFSLPGYYKNFEDKIYLNMNLNKTLPGDKLDISNRSQVVEHEYCYQDTSVIILTVPEGYTPSFIPENTSASFPEYGIQSTYRVSGNTIVLQKSMYVNYLYLTKDKFQQWNDFLQSVNTINQQSVILTKSN